MKVWKNKSPNFSIYDFFFLGAAKKTCQHWDRTEKKVLFIKKRLVYSPWTFLKFKEMKTEFVKGDESRLWKVRDTFKILSNICRGTFQNLRKFSVFDRVLNMALNVTCSQLWCRKISILRYPYNFRKIPTKTLRLVACNFLKNEFYHWCFLVTFAKFFRICIL